MELKMNQPILDKKTLFKLFKYAEWLARRFWKHYYRIYRSNFLDKTDLIQEAYLITIEMMLKDDNRTKPLRELEKLTARYVRFKMQKMKHQSVRFLLSTIRLPGSYDDNTDISDYYLCYSYILNNKVKKEVVKFEEIKKFCKKTEYVILYKKLREGKTFKEISAECNILPNTCYKIYAVAIAKLQKKLFFDGIKKIVSWFFLLFFKNKK